jgi:hypothetical protein
VFCIRLALAEAATRAALNVSHLADCSSDADRVKVNVFF